MVFKKELEEKKVTTLEELNGYKKMLNDTLNSNTEKYLEDNKNILNSLKEKGYDVKKLNLIMKNYIECQLSILIKPFIYTYFDEEKKDYKTIEISRNFGLMEDFHKIKNPLNDILHYPTDCYTTYLRSETFKNKVEKDNKVNVLIPKVFVEYITNL